MGEGVTGEGVTARLFVWVGGVWFVLSLALTSWAYAFWFGQSRPFAGAAPVAVNATLMTGFALHHSLFARAGMKARLSRIWPARLLRSLYVWIASLLLIALCLAWQPIGGDFYDASGWRRGLHAVVQLTGVWLIARSVRAIDALELAGIRQFPAGPAADTLQVRGPYRLVRHPLYLGWMLVVFGTEHLTGDRLAFAALTSLYLVIAIPWEERSLEEEFGAQYADYKRQVRWRVIPYLY